MITSCLKRLENIQKKGNVSDSSDWNLETLSEFRLGNVDQRKRSVRTSSCQIRSYSSFLSGVAVAKQNMIFKLSEKET